MRRIQLKLSLIFLLLVSSFLMTSCQQSEEEKVLKALVKDIGQNKSAAYIIDKYYVLDESEKEAYLKEVYTEDYFDGLYNAMQSPKMISKVTKDKNVVTVVINQNDSIKFLFQGKKIRSSVQMFKGERVVGWI